MDITIFKKYTKLRDFDDIYNIIELVGQGAYGLY